MANSHMTFGVDLLPRTTNTYNLGNSNQKWNVWINQINGSTPVTSVNTQTGDVVITAANLGAYVKPNDGIPDIDIASAINWNAKQEPMVILSYGTSTWDDFIDAYNKHAVVYCRASSNSNPASGAQTRLAFMAYVNANPPTTEVEFQYYRSVSSHSATQMSDQVYIYKLNKTNGWSVTVREASLKQLKTGTGLDVAYSGNIATVSPSLVSTTALTNAATAATETANRVYPVALDANGKLAVNVPWTGGSTISSIPLADVTDATNLQAIESAAAGGNTGFLQQIANGQWTIDSSVITSSNIDDYAEVIVIRIEYNGSNFYVSSIEGPDNSWNHPIIGIYVDNNTSSVHYYRGVNVDIYQNTLLLVSLTTDNIGENIIIEGFQVSDMSTANPTLTFISIPLGTITNSAITIPLSNISSAEDLKLIEALTGQGILKRTSNGWTLTSLGSELSSSNITTALGYTPYDSSNPMGYTSNVGTITGITMNGTSKGTSGVVNLGTVVTDVSDKVSGPATATATHVATFSNTTGKVIQDSGYTIGTSVPSNAVFTDTTTSVSYSTTPASVNVSTTGATGSIVLGEAATKQVDSTVTSSSTNLPTSAAVATYVQQNTGSADWADITYSSMDTTDIDYEPGAEYLYNHIRPSNTDTIIGSNVTVTNNGYITAANVTVSQVNVKGTGAVWQWIPTSTGLELVCAPVT